MTVIIQLGSKFYEVDNHHMKRTSPKQIVPMNPHVSPNPKYEIRQIWWSYKQLLFIAVPVSLLKWCCDGQHKEPMICKDHLDGQSTNELEKHMIRKTITLCEGYHLMMRSSRKQVVPINPHIYSHCNPPTLHLAAHHHHLRHRHHHHFDHLCGHSQMLLILFAERGSISHWLHIGWNLSKASRRDDG